MDVYTVITTFLEEEEEENSTADPTPTGVTTRIMEDNWNYKLLERFYCVIDNADRVAELKLQGTFVQKGVALFTVFTQRIFHISDRKQTSCFGKFLMIIDLRR